MSAALADYLRAQAGRAFVWAECDCATFGMDWAALLSGRRPANRQPLPGSLREFLARQHDLPLEIEVGDWLRRAGFVPGMLDAPRPGDIAVAIMSRLPTVLIRTPSRWVGRGPRGLVAPLRPQLLRAWSWPEQI